MNENTKEELAIAALIEPRLKFLAKQASLLNGDPENETVRKNLTEWVTNLKQLIVSESALAGLINKRTSFPVTVDGMNCEIVIDAANVQAGETVGGQDFKTIKIMIQSKNRLQAPRTANETTPKPTWLKEVINVPGKFQSYLHRTDFSLVDNILMTGFQAGADLKSTAHPLPDEDFSMHMLRSSHLNSGSKTPNLAGIIFHIPEVIFQVAKKRQQEAYNKTQSGNLMDAMMTAPNITVDEILAHELGIGEGGRQRIKIPPEWIYGVVDLRDLTKPPVRNAQYGKQNTQLEEFLSGLQKELAEK